MQSVNGGMYEAAELARCMSRILTGRATHAALETFERPQRRGWSVILGIDQRVRGQVHAGPWLTENAARIVPCIPAAPCDLNSLLRPARLELTELRRPT